MSVLVFCTSAMSIETFNDEAGMKKFADQFMGIIGKGDLNKAYDFIKPYVNMNSVEVDSAAEESKQHRQKFAMQYGPSKGYQFISEKKVGNFLYRLLYIEKAEKQALPWVFYFYKNGKVWRLDEFDWTDQASVLFQSN
jgi:hypothetical protein